MKDRETGSLSNGNFHDGNKPAAEGAGSSIDEAELVRRRVRLEEQLSALRPADLKPQNAGPVVGYGQALKLGSEFIAGILVGLGLGWALDKGLGTSPFGLIVFVLLGFAAGVLNMLRSQGMVPQRRIKPPRDGSNGDKT